MRIAFVNSTRKWGGVKTWCLDMGEALQRQGHSVWIYGRTGEFIERARRRGIEACGVDFGLDFNPRLMLRLGRDFRRHRVDRVVVNVGKDLRSAGVVARMLGIPLVQHLGAPGDLRDTVKTRMAQRWLRPRLLACSEFVRAELLRRVPVLAGSDFVALHPGTTLGPKPQHVQRAQRVILSASRLDADKGHFELLDALAKLEAAGVAFRCVILGTGTEAESLRARALALGLDERITWAGFQSDVRPFLRQADLFVLPSRCEPLGIVLQEAMAHGLVPVARRAGGVPEIWPPELEALLYAPDRGVEGLRHALGLVFAIDDAELQRWKLAAWKHARRTFDLEIQSRRFAEWMQLPGSPPPGSPAVERRAFSHQTRVLRE